MGRTDHRVAGTRRRGLGALEKLMAQDVVGKDAHPGIDAADHESDADS
jgi:hypothetical protein